MGCSPLSALLLLLLMVFVGVHLRASLPVKWKDAPWQEAGREGKTQASELMNNKLDVRIPSRCCTLETILY